MRSRDIVLAGVLVLSAAVMRAQTGPVAGKMAKDVMKNVRVLTDVSVEDWNDTMWFMTTSLGVNCGYCHVVPAFEKEDQKAKQTARSMIQMVRELNAKNFGGQMEITCFTCHQGSTKPRVSAPLWNKTPEELAALKKGPPAGAAAAPKEQGPLPAAEEVLARYRKATGSESVKTIHVKVAVTFDTQGPAELEADVSGPDKLLQLVKTGGVEARLVINGAQGWIIAPGRAGEMPAADVAAAKKMIALYGPVKLSKEEAPRKTTGLETLDGRTYAVVESRSERRLERYYFDTETGLLHRLYGETHTPLGLMPSEVTVEDYRDISGVKMPFLLTQRSNNNRARYTFSEIQINPPIDSARFERPKEIPAGK